MLMKKNSLLLPLLFAVVFDVAVVNAQVFKSVDEAYNPDEERGSFELVMKPYPIPAETTTYVDFYFNLPDDLPELFHLTYGEIINSQPQHLHHLFITACPNKIDPSQEGLPQPFVVVDDCMHYVVGGWAPGADIFGNTDLDTGILIGRGLGIQSLKINVHYTDGVYEDEDEKTLKMATDGVRVHYTPNFRPYTSVSKYLINAISAPSSMLTIPPNESRFFLSRTCKVDTRCKDADEKTLGIVAYFMESMDGYFDDGIIVDALTTGGGGDGDADADAELSCGSITSYCDIGGEIGSYVQRLCPASCGLCETKGMDGTAMNNPFNPDTYRITAVHYHAHLLGREMYTTLIPVAADDDEEEQEQSASKTTVANTKQASLVVPKDIQSRDVWIFDNQELIPLDFDVMVQEEDDATMMMMRGTEIKAGDKIQSTCVYDSTSREEPTKIGPSTYDEMCFNSVLITFDTPASLLLLNNGTDNDATMAAAAAPAARGIVDLLTELELMKFSCADDTAEADVYSGILNADEDGRNIWKDHPIEDTEGCTFVTNDFLSGALTEETRNCDNGEGESGNGDEGDGVPISGTVEGSPEDDALAFVSSSPGGGHLGRIVTPIILSAMATSVSFVLAVIML